MTAANDYTKRKLLLCKCSLLFCALMIFLASGLFNTMAENSDRPTKSESDLVLDFMTGKHVKGDGPVEVEIDTVRYRIPRAFVARMLGTPPKPDSVWLLFRYPQMEPMSQERLRQECSGERYKDCIILRPILSQARDLKDPNIAHVWKKNRMSLSNNKEPIKTDLGYDLYKTGSGDNRIEHYYKSINENYISITCFHSAIKPPGSCGVKFLSSFQNEILLRFDLDYFDKAEDMIISVRNLIDSFVISD